MRVRKVQGIRFLAELNFNSDVKLLTKVVVVIVSIDYINTGTIQHGCLQ